MLNVIELGCHHQRKIYIYISLKIYTYKLIINGGNALKYSLPVFKKKQKTTNYIK
uniref:Uncharacterized protein n=1 Tax=Lepeophtheirus salmonis TaxID=72036 RepID=A0A0K2T895_LEPSM